MNDDGLQLSQHHHLAGADGFISGKVKKLADGKVSIGPTVKKTRAVALGGMAGGLYYFQKK